jgi:uncharacterized iron-regulated membrane protein
VKRPSRWEDWVIAGAILALFVTGLLTVFDDEIAKLRGKDDKKQDVDGVVVPGSAQPL